MQIKTIEQKLNKLCSQHDEYMALLDIIDYLANLKNLTQNNRTIYNKITQLEQQIQEIKQGQNNQRVQQKQFGSLKLEKLKKNITNIEQKLLNYGIELSHLDLSIKKVEMDNEHFTFNQELSKTNITIETIMEKQISLLQSSIAIFKNQLECRIIEINGAVNTNKKSIHEAKHQGEDSKFNAAQINENAQQLANSQQTAALVNQLFKANVEAYDQLMHEIMLYKVQFANPPLLPYVRHNCQSIKQKIAWLYSKVNIHDQLNTSEFTIIQNEYETIAYRIKALKNHALCELLQLYEENERKLQAQKLQKQVEPLLRQLQNRSSLFRDFLDKAELMRKCRQFNSSQNQTEVVPANP